MPIFISSEVRHEVQKAISRPWRLPRTLLTSAVSTLGGLFIAISFHWFHKGLPYAAAELFVWTLASYNASQLGNDSDNVLTLTKRRRPLREIFILKNVSLLIISIPIDIALVSLACLLLGDWSRFWLSLPLAIVAVIISLGLGNIVSVAWVYKPTSLWKIRHNRLKLAEYVIFVCLSYIAASAALYITTFPAEVLYHHTNLQSVSSVLFGLILLAAWAALWWTLSLKVAEFVSARYEQHFIARLMGKAPKIANPKLKKVLKVA